MGTFILKPNQTMVPSFPSGKYYTKAESNARFAPIGGGGSLAIGSGISGSTAGDVLFADSSLNLAHNNANFYFQNSSTTPTALSVNTNVALSINASGDLTGTDAVNIYGQFDAFLPNSAITNSLAGLNTDGAFPGYTTSSTRGTGASPSQLQTGDMVGGYFGFGTQGASSPTYQNLGGMGITTVGASANSLGGQLNFYTKADGGSLALNAVLTGAGLFGIATAAPTHTLTLGSTSTGLAAYNTSDQTVNYERVRQYWSGNQFIIDTENGGTGTLRNIVITTTNTNKVIMGTTTPLSTTNYTLHVQSGGNSGGIIGGSSTSALQYTLGRIPATNNGIFALYPGTTSADVSLKSGPNVSNWSNAFNQATNTNGNPLIQLTPTISQSSVAGYRALWISPFENSLGSGTQVLIEAGTNSAAAGSGTHTSKFSVTSGGNVITSAPIRLKGYTVATLPSGTQGDTAFVTDALAPTYNATVVGGGAVAVRVFYNGTNWVT